MRKRLLLSSCITFLIFFAALSKYEDRQVLRNLDFAVTTKVQYKIDASSHLRFTDLVANIMTGSTFFASPEFIAIATFIITGILVYDRKTKRWNIKALVVPAALTLIVLGEIYGKSIVHHPSPPFSMIKNPTTVFAKDYINEQFSYPSGHSARAIFLAVLAFLLFIKSHKKIQKGTLFLLASLVGYVFLVGVSRIYLGHHWFSDVAGGLLLGASMGSLTLLALW